MPLGFIKKKRKYNITTKGTIIVVVQLLDNSIRLECTLNSDSSGRDCLENIIRRMNLSHNDLAMELFGLRYINKNMQFRWIDLDKPLKKQLEKQAEVNSERLFYFGVMYYFANAHQIKDEAIRCQYYLQLKSDVIEGRINCDSDQAASLATLSLHAEFGDGKFDKNTLEFLGMSPSEAQINYILAVQRLHGYGVEYYKAHDTDGKEVFLGTSFVGILVKPSNSEERTIYFEWDKICKFVRNKKSLGIVSGQQTLYYHLQDNDQCKYIWRIVSKFHWFYKNKPFSVVIDHDITKPINLSDVPKFPQMPDIQLSSITDHVDDPANTRAYINMVASETPHMADMYMNLKRNENSYDTASPEPVYSNGLPAYRPAPSYDEAVNRRNLLNKMHSSSPDLASLPLYQNTSAFSTPDLYKPPPDVIRALDKSMENIAEACEETNTFKLSTPFHCQQSSNVSESSQKSIFYEIASPVLINADRQPIDERRRQLEMRLAQAETEFESIALVKANADFFNGKQSIKEFRNRDTGILPYDHNRIKLSSTSSNSNGYINASSIKLRLPGSSRRHPPTMEWRFIVGQLPSNKETEWDLWQMIWEKKVSTIVLLDNEAMYWNREINHSKSFGDMEVYTKCVDRSSPGYATWRLRVMNKNTAAERDVWQLELTSWSDSNAFMSLIQECRTLQASNHESSLLVLCENGAGKSGSYVLADVMTACLQSNADVDLPKVLRLIREQRMHAVQTAEQYIFVYRTLLRFLDASRLI